VFQSHVLNTDGITVVVGCTVGTVGRMASGFVPGKNGARTPVFCGELHRDPEVASPCVTTSNNTYNNGSTIMTLL